MSGTPYNNPDNMQASTSIEKTTSRPQTKFLTSPAKDNVIAPSTAGSRGCCRGGRQRRGIYSKPGLRSPSR